VLVLTAAGLELRGRLIDALIDTTPLAVLDNSERHQLGHLLDSLEGHSPP